MINKTISFRLLLGVTLAHLLLFFSFHEQTIFWYIFTGSILLLILYSKLQSDVDDKIPFSKYASLGIISGFLLYIIFWIGNKGIYFFHLPFGQSIKTLYHYYAPTKLWEYLALIIVAAPGEEIFWRGFIQKTLLKSLRSYKAIFIGAILYASTQIYSGELILIFGTFLCGIAWGSLYFWKKSMPLVIVSHILFDLTLFLFIPLS